MKNFILATAFAVLAASAQAQLVAFNNFGPGDTYQINNSSTISAAGSAAGLNTQGFQFTSAESGAVTSITVAAAHIFATNAVDFQLFADNSGVLGSAVGSAVTLTNRPAFGSPSLVSFVPAGASLVAGQKYWLVASANGDAFMGWNQALFGNNGPRYSLTGSGATYSTASNQAAFRVETVPEPMTMSVLAGLGLLAARRRKKA